MKIIYLESLKRLNRYAEYGYAPISYDEIVFKESINKYIYGWLLPNGDFYEVSFTDHVDFIKNFLKNDNNYKREMELAIKKGEMEDQISYAYINGWIRIGIKSNNYIDASGAREHIYNNENLRRLSDILGLPLKLSVATYLEFEK